MQLGDYARGCLHRRQKYYPPGGLYHLELVYFRPRERYVTVIDGQNSVRGVMIIKYNSTASLIMDGFTIQNGLAQGNNTSDDYNSRGFGGGIWSQRAPMTLTAYDPAQ